MNSRFSGLRAFDVITLVLATLLSLGSTWMLFVINKELTNSIEIFDDNLPAFSLRAEYELSRLESVLNRFMLGNSSQSEVQLRYDILLARLNNYEATFDSEDLQSNDVFRDDIAVVLDVMQRLETPLFTLQPGDVAAAASIDDNIQSMYRPLEELTTLTRESHNGLLSMLDNGLATGIQVGFALIVATVLISALMLTRFWYTFKEEARFRADLEKQIQARTKDLQISNTFLKNEIVERKRVEKSLNEREQQMHRVQKMEAVGRVTTGVAHDFNNLLAVIMGNIELLKSSNDKTASGKHLESALAATVMGSQLTRKLLAFGRRSPLKPEIVDVNKVIMEIDDLLIHSLSENVSLELRLSNGIWPISVDRSLLENVMLNLVINARDAVQDEGSILIETRNKLDQENQSLGGDSLGFSGDCVCVSVTDTGSGMTAQVLEQVFEPFFSTKTETEGSGLGLSMASGFVQQSKGSIDIDSAPGKGTTVQLLFPRCVEDLDTIHSKDQLAFQPTSSKYKVLVVEDSEAVRQVVVEQLRMLGYETLEASGGADALVMIKTDRSIDLLLSDVVMPGELQGLELAERVRQLRPELKIVIMTGYPKGTEHKGAESENRFTKLMKPVSLTQLASTLGAELQNNPLKTPEENRNYLYR